MLTRWENLLKPESVSKVWDTRDRAVFGGFDRAMLTGPCAKEAEIWARQPGWRRESQPGKPEYVNLFLTHWCLNGAA